MDRGQAWMLMTSAGFKIKLLATDFYICFLLCSFYARRLWLVTAKQFKFVNDINFNQLRKEKIRNKQMHTHTQTKKVRKWCFEVSDSSLCLLWKEKWIPFQTRVWKAIHAFELQLLSHSMYRDHLFHCELQPDVQIQFARLVNSIIFEMVEAKQQQKMRNSLPIAWF